MRLIGYLLLIGIGAVVASYFPLTPFLPAKTTVMSAIEDNAPFLADWLPEEEAAEPQEEPETIAQAEVDELDDALSAVAEDPDAQIWTSFETSTIVELLTEMGLTNEIIDDDDGSSFVKATNSNGYSFFANPRLCGEDGSNCLGLNIYSVFDANPSAEKMTALNERYAYMKFYSSSDNELILQKYFTADYGIARGNVKVNFMTFLDILDSFQEVLNEETSGD